jgi:iron complex outermembrane receptor protein
MGEFTLRRFLLLTALLSGASSAAFAQVPTRAQPPSDAAAEEVVVTAQRREQSAQEVPLALSVLGDRMINQLNVTDSTSLTSSVPGLSGANQGLLQPVIVVRGISSSSFGIGGEASVGIFVDDAYIGRLSGSSVPFFDIERIEVLRGPQGSLYGRNSTAGAISVTTKKADLNDPYFEVSGSYGRFNQYEASAVGSVPLNDRTAVRLAVLARGDDGYDRNIVNRKFGQNLRAYGGRASIVFKASETLEINASLSASQERGGDYPFKTSDAQLAALSGADTNPFSGRYAHDVVGKEDRTSVSGNLAVAWGISDKLSVKSISTFNFSDVRSLLDVDGSALPLLQADFDDGIARTFGQEVRLTYNTDPVLFQFGASAFIEQIRDKRTLTYDETLTLGVFTAAVFGGDGSLPADLLFAGSPSFLPCDATATALLGLACSSKATEVLRQRGRYQSYAAFADAEFKVTKDVSVTLGGRYSVDTKRFVFSAPLVNTQGSALFLSNPVLGGATDGLDRKRTWQDFQPRAVIRWQPNEDTNVYASVTRGFKSGGFDPAARNGAYDAALSQFGAESVWSYEVGLKAGLFDRLAELNLSVYRFDYRGLQVQILRNAITSTLNIPEYNGVGVEADVTFRPARRTNITLGGAFNDAEFGSLVVDVRGATGVTTDLRGNKAVLAPRVTGFLRGDTVVALSPTLELRISGDVTWRDRQFFTIYNDPREKQDAYALVGGAIGLSSSKSGLTVSLVGQNLADQKYLTYAVEQGFGVVTARGRPRTISIEGRWVF